MTITHVDDSELLYRAIRAGTDEYRLEADGRLRFTANAFKDSFCKPSVDRSSLRMEPRDTRFNSSDGVASLITKDVRAIGSVSVRSPDGKEVKLVYSVDVHHRPIAKSDEEPRENPAHCQIECAPEIKNTHFKKLKEALALLATERGWVVEPEQSP